MQSYALIFEVDGQQWRELDEHPSGDTADAYAKVRLQMVVEERKPRAASVRVIDASNNDTPRGVWAFSKERWPDLVWRPAGKT